MKLNKIFPTLGLASVLAVVAPLASSCTVYVSHEDDPDPEPTGEYEYDFLESGRKVYPAESRYEQETLESDEQATQVYFDKISKEQQIFVDDMFNQITEKWVKYSNILQLKTADLNVEITNISMENNQILLDMACQHHLSGELQSSTNQLITEEMDIEVFHLPIDVFFTKESAKWSIEPCSFKKDLGTCIKQLLSNKEWYINVNLIESTIPGEDIHDKDTKYDYSNFFDSDKNIIVPSIQIVFEELFSRTLPFFDDIPAPVPPVPPVSWDYEFDFVKQQKAFDSTFNNGQDPLPEAKANEYYFTKVLDKPITPNTNLLEEDVLDYITHDWANISGAKFNEAYIKLGGFSVGKKTIQQQDLWLINMKLDYRLHYVDESKNEVDLTYSSLYISNFPMEITWAEDHWQLLPIFCNKAIVECALALQNKEIGWEMKGQMIDSGKPTDISLNCSNCMIEKDVNPILEHVINDLLEIRNSAFLKETPLEE